MKKLSFALLFVSSAGFAAEVTSLKCEADQRPVDGAYKSVELVKNELGKFDAYYHVITPGFGSPVTNVRVKIAANMTACSFATVDPRLSYCSKFEREEGERTNTGFVSKKVAETSVDGPSGATRTTESIDITVFSPLLVAGGPGFPKTERPGWFTVRFSAKNNSGILLNRCTVQN